MMRLLLVLTMAGEAGLAVSTFRGLTPGESNSAAVQAALGRPIRSAVGEAEHDPGDGSGTVVVYYRGDVTERMEWRFASSLARGAVIQALKLIQPVATSSAGGVLLEYFGGDYTTVLVHEDASAQGNIAMVVYGSQAWFNAQVARLNQGGPSTPTTTAPPVAFTPSACRDLYEWARKEQEPAFKTKDAKRKQAILELRVAAQKGDCEEARKLAEDYRARFRPQGGR